MEKNFMIRCPKCRWGQATSGIAEDLKGLFEIKPTCNNCGHPRKFRCPKCGSISKMSRIRGNT